jgi:hypothetical protein
VCQLAPSGTIVAELWLNSFSCRFACKAASVHRLKVINEFGAPPLARLMGRIEGQNQNGKAAETTRPI